MLFLILGYSLLLQEDAVSTYIWATLRTGPAQDLAEDVQKKAMAGHFSNMGKLAEEGKLLLAGPLGPPRSEPDHRGIFILNTEDLTEAQAWSGTDPAAKAGIFAISLHRFTTTAPLDLVLKWEREAQAAREADPEIPNEWQGRPYRLATSPELKTLDPAPSVLFQGQLKGFGPSGSTVWLVALDASDDQDARALLPDDREWTLHGWYSGVVLEQLSRTSLD